MFWAILLILLTLWYLGLFTGYTISGGIHVLMVIAIIMLVERIIQEKKYYSDLTRLPEKVRYLERSVASRSRKISPTL